MGGGRQEAGPWTVPEKKTAGMSAPSSSDSPGSHPAPTCLWGPGRGPQVSGVSWGWGEENLLQRYRGRGIERDRDGQKRRERELGVKHSQTQGKSERDPET